jgi:uncharacterized protein (DUF486 family)
MYLPILLLGISNVFMTAAWYGHLRDHRDSPLWLVVLASWGIAFFEYCFQVPANRLGAQFYSVPQLKVIQEAVTLIVFAGFSVMYLKQEIKLDYVWAALCLLGAVYFVFRS